MSFDTYTFLFLFLPCVVAVYFALELAGRWRCRNSACQVDTVNPLLPAQNAWLLVASLFLYAWSEPVYVCLLIAASMVAWCGGMLMKRFGKAGNNSMRKAVMIITVSLLVMSLGVFKYLGFLTENLNLIPSLHIPVVKISLPIGISFYTFQILSYVIDLYRGNVAVQRNPFRLLLYVSLFPQLIAGPIVRYQTVESELTQRRASLDDIQEGTFRFIRGLAKKILIADNVARLSDAIYGVYGNALSDTFAPDCTGTTALWIASLAYTLQIYFDFSGYSDMAIGLGRIFGFHFLENFNFPYISRSITEFWRRWHISLSGWFRDYVYIPLGGSRCTVSRRAVNIMVVWMLTGFWHGAAWNFILWGLYYGFILMAEKAVLDRMGKKTVTSLWGWAYAFIVVNLGWVLFHLTDFAMLKSVLHDMFIYHPTDWLRLMAENSDTLLALVYIPIGLFFCFPVLTFIAERKTTTMIMVRTIAAVLLLLLSIVYIVSSSFHPFIYFRF